MTRRLRVYPCKLHLGPLPVPRACPFCQVAIDSIRAGIGMAAKKPPKPPSKKTAARKAAIAKENKRLAGYIGSLAGRKQAKRA